MITGISLNHADPDAIDPWELGDMFWAIDPEDYPDIALDTIRSATEDTDKMMLYGTTDSQRIREIEQYVNDHLIDEE